MRNILLFVIWAMATLPILAQQKEKAPLFMEKGIVLGYGNGIDTLNIPEGKYAVVYLMAHLGIDIFRNKPLKKIPGKCVIYFEPQINPVFIKQKNNTGHAFEFGMNVGFQHIYPLVKNFLSTYILIASGPHFISVHTEKQARGFIFSDNLGAGVYLFTKGTLTFNLGFRLRHMSNANTRFPNQGINTFNYQVGISKFIR